MIVIYSIFKISSCDMSSITAKLHENLVSGFRELAITVTVVYLNLVKYLSSKEALLKKTEFLRTCASSQYVLSKYKVSRNSVEQFQINCGGNLFQ